MRNKRINSVLIHPPTRMEVCNKHTKKSGQNRLAKLILITFKLS
ncbi:hypothetical protein HMPREF9265_1319 [Limosilactobacillus oris PB013-T2-3]|uniref:Uncharacterized protein n=1 Tax=Limosilactobacillus oris PB013-T2-3 TaxID=908339 RepID=E3C9J4_9LACO|nr:hypothetical protein HMPREF9265_1319 [Limosilactobacillus oris PB013-T2-3]